MAAGVNLIPVPPEEMERTWKLPDHGTIGIIFFIIMESALFTIFVMAYLIYMGKSLTGPYPKDVLHTPIVASICLWGSSLTVWFAEKACEKGRILAFKLWWLATICLGLEFLTYTGLEWKELIYGDHLTIATNLFGTTFYSLVGLHASHVFVGMVFLLIVFITTMLGFPIQTQARRVKFLSWYWHFVDGIWIVVFTVVYIVGK